MVVAIVLSVKLCVRKWVRQEIKDLANSIKTLSSNTKRWVPPKQLNLRKRRNKFCSKLKPRRYLRKRKATCRRLIGVRATS